MINKQDVIANVRQQISDLAGTTFSPSDLDVFFKGALNDYQKAKPLNTRGSFITVANQAFYDVPTGLQEILDVTVWGTPMRSQIMRDFFAPIPPPFIDPATFYQYDEAAAGAFYTNMANVGDMWKPNLNVEWVTDTTILGVAAPKYMIRVDPFPLTDGATIQFVYTIPHTADTTGNYPSIPDFDADIVENLMLADLLDTIAIDLSKQGVIKAGDSTIDTTNSADDLRSQATSARRKAYGQLEADVAIRRI